MQSILRRSQNSLPALRRQAIPRSRSYADEATSKAAPARGAGLGGISPIVFAATVLAVVPGYYIYHSGKPPGEGQAARKEARRSGLDPSQEKRDPRDSDVKTLEQKKAKAGQ